MTQVLPPSPSVVLLEQMGVLAEHPVNLGQDAAKSILLHLGKVEAAVHLGGALVQIWHTDGLCTWDHKNRHGLSAYAVINIDFISARTCLC